MIREEDQVFAKVVARHNLLPPEAIAEGLKALEADDKLTLKEIFQSRGLLTRAPISEGPRYEKPNRNVVCRKWRSRVGE